jgi:hypothetical protein
MPLPAEKALISHHHHHHHLFTFHRSLFGNNMPLDVEIVIHIIKKIAKLQL